MTVAELAAAIKEPPPVLPPITQLDHITLHSQPPHGLVLMAKRPQAASRRREGPSSEFRR